jgi:hypothetical protein
LARYTPFYGRFFVFLCGYKNGMNRTFAIKSYLRYLAKAGHRKGFGIHSPFVFSLLNSVFYEKLQYYCYERIEDLRDQLTCEKAVVRITDRGTGGYKERTLGNIVKRSVKRTKYAQLLFRLANSNRSKIILDVGYLCRADNALSLAGE